MLPRWQPGWNEFGASLNWAGGWARPLERRCCGAIPGREQFSAFSRSRAFSFNPQKPAMFPRRIAYVLKIFPKLSETFIAEELAELRRRGIELRILSLLPPRRELRHGFILSAGLEPLTIYQPEEFSSVLSAFRPQLLHAHFATEAIATAIELAGELR